MFDGRASPARFTVRIEPGKPLIRSNSAITEGTVLSRLTPGSCPISARLSAFRTMIVFPPQLSGAKISNTERSKQIEVEANTPSNSSAEKTSRAHCSSTFALLCWMATPFGLPVDPEV